MPVPTSSLIFALAAAVPFGLAIKDTATGKYDREPIFDENSGSLLDDEDSGDALERYGEEQEQAVRALEAYRMRHAAELEGPPAKLHPAEDYSALFGAEVATIGTRFEDLSLGGPKGARDVSQLWPDHDVVLLDDGATTHTLFVKVSSDEDACDELANQIGKVWEGRSHTTAHGAIWVNHAIHQRAVIDSANGCALTFETIAPVDQWFAKTAAAVVPIAAIGRPVKQLTQVLGARGVVGDNGNISWTAPGIGVGAGTTSITAYTRGGIVVGLFASVTADQETQDAVVEQITSVMGNKPTLPAEDAAGDGNVDGPRVWKTQPKIVIQAGSQIFLRIGEQRD